MKKLYLVSLKSVKQVFHGTCMSFRIFILIVTYLGMFATGCGAENGLENDNIVDVYNLNRAIQNFKRKLKTNAKDIEASKALVISLIKLSRYKEAYYYLENSHLPTDVFCSLYNQLQTHENIYKYFKSFPEPAKKARLNLNFNVQVKEFETEKKRINSNSANKKNWNKILVPRRQSKVEKNFMEMAKMDFILNSDLDYKIREICSMQVNNNEIIESNYRQLTRLLKYGSEIEKILALNVLEKYFGDKTGYNPGNTSNLNSLERKIVSIYCTWMRFIIASGHTGMKYKLIKLGRKMPSNVIMDLFSPLFRGKQRHVVKRLVKLFQDSDDITPLIERYDKATFIEKKHILEVLRKRSGKEAIPVVKKALYEKNWQLQWLAYNLISETRLKEKNIIDHIEIVKRDRSILSKKCKKPLLKKSELSVQNVILISIDTLRSDSLGCYGFPEHTSPYLDWFAKRNIQLENCYTNASWTLPSHVSMMTSKNPHQHGVQKSGNMINVNETLLTEILHSKNMLTIAYINNPFLFSNYGFHRGFDIYDEQGFHNASQSVDYLTRWLIWYKNKKSKEELKRPFFFFLHVNDVHSPYPRNAWPYNVMYEQLKNKREKNKMTDYAMYHSMLYYVDQQLGRLIKTIHKLGMEQKTAAFVTSDHGEAFGEHGYFGHGIKGNNEELLVPLIIKVPNINFRGVIYDTNYQTIDIAPTILSILGYSKPNDFTGTDILSRLNNTRGKRNSRDSLSETIAYGDKIISLFSGKYKYMNYFSLKDNKVYSEEVFDLEQDPAEKKSLAEDKKEVLKEMRDKLNNALNNLSTYPTRTRDNAYLDEETREALKQLGYLQDN